jgi:hypothetical protein
MHKDSEIVDKIKEMNTEGLLITRVNSKWRYLWRWLSKLNLACVHTILLFCTMKDDRNTCSNLIWWVQKTFLNILVSPNWKWWVQDSFRWVARFSEMVNKKICMYIFLFQSLYIYQLWTFYEVHI